MSEADMHDLAAAYAVDAVDPDERAAFEAHLADCDRCRREVEELQDLALVLSDGLEVEPPAQLRASVLDLVATEARGPETAGAARDAAGGEAAATGSPADGDATATAEPHEDGAADVTSLDARRRHRAPTRGPGRWLAAAAAAVVLAGGVWGVSQALNPDPATQVIRADDASEHTADTEDGPVAVIVSAAEGRAVVQLPAEFASPRAGSVYQAWFVSADGTARSAGVLQPEMLEERTALLEGSPDDAVAVGFTVEPTGGSDQPTTEPFVVVPLA
ncbi:anti-sigma factor [Serinicoccus kebangsaanensis]|uniref:anti-sigma factor n=1 Tax=Serinicoccus kebangsaanensis TaxID=2602069 RepID=UPI00124E5D66|nr:anti-sigma factor [Serinicoccus kebangsaanensis]